MLKMSAQNYIFFSKKTIILNKKVLINQKMLIMAYLFCYYGIVFVFLHSNYCVVMRKSFIFSFLILLFCCFFTTPVVAQKADKFVVIIDAGHGGEDPGAIGKYSQEKDLNLSVALLLGQMIEKNYPEVKLLYTRNSDVFVPLKDRADFVNSNINSGNKSANLFICIHTNAVSNRKVIGAETYTMSYERADENLEVVKLENDVIKLEANYQDIYQEPDPDSFEAQIQKEEHQRLYLRGSMEFAELVQKQFADVLHRGDRGVRQAGFWVLRKTTCPGVLVEMGFISNPDEEKYLNSKKGQEEITNAIFSAFEEFYKKKKKLLEDVGPGYIGQDTITEPVAHIAEEFVQPAKGNSKPYYAVQVLATNKKMRLSDSELKGLKGCSYFEKDGWFKYYHGKTHNRQDAVKHQQELKQTFPECFVITLPD